MASFNKNVPFQAATVRRVKRTGTAGTKMTTAARHLMRSLQRRPEDRQDRKLPTLRGKAGGAWGFPDAGLSFCRAIHVSGDSTRGDPTLSADT